MADPMARPLDAPLAQPMTNSQPKPAPNSQPVAPPVAPMGNARFDGFASIAEIGPLGMITLRAKPDLPGLTAAFAALGLTLPDARRITHAGDKAAGWMSVDEYLLIVPYAEAGSVMASLSASLAGQHHLVANVSDARAVFRITGPKADQVLRKLCPVDLDRLAPGELRRTRAAQVAGAFWHDGQGYTVVCFRSVAAYMMGLLEHSAKAGSELF